VDGWTPIIYKVLYIPGGASTVGWVFSDISESDPKTFLVAMDTYGYFFLNFF